MGFEIERFVENHVEEEFICSICHNVLEEPTLIKTCEHVFCADCIRKWMENSRTCPIDRGSIQGGHLQPPQRLFRDLLGKLKIRCDFVTQGCSEVLKLGNLKDHCAKCYFNPDVKKECPIGCGALLSDKERDTHDCFEYLYAKCSTKDAMIAAQQEEITELRSMVFTDATKNGIIRRARAARNNPTFFQNHMDEKMTKEVIEIAANSIEKIDYWWYIANDIREQLDRKYGPYWGCCVANAGMRNVAITIDTHKHYIDFYFADLSVFIWKNA